MGLGGCLLVRRLSSCRLWLGYCLLHEKQFCWGIQILENKGDFAVMNGDI